MFTKTVFLLSALATAFLATSSVQASVILWSNDFEEGSSAVWVPITAQNSVSIVNDPTGATNKVLQVNDKGAAASAVEWGEIRPSTITYYALQPIGVTAGVDTATLSVKLYIPDTAVSTGTDRINLILRYSNVASPSSGQFKSNSVYYDFASLAKNQWHTIALQNVSILAFGIPDGGSTETSLYITPVIAMADYAAYNGAGVFAYLDDVRLTVTPEPTRLLLLFGGILALTFKRRR